MHITNINSYLIDETKVNMPLDKDGNKMEVFKDYPVRLLVKIKSDDKTFKVGEEAVVHALPNGSVYICDPRYSSLCIKSNAVADVHFTFI